MEKREVFLGGGGCAGSVGTDVFAVVGAVSAEIGAGFAGAEGTAFFFFGFRDTDSGLNIMGLPTSFTSSAGFCSAGTDGPSCFLDGAPAPSPSSPPNKSPTPLSSSRLKAAAELVFRLIPGRGLALPPAVAAALGLFAFFGAGRNELKPEKRPPLPSPVRARFAGGSSLVEEEVAWGRLTRILPGLERSTTFWKGFFEVLVVDCLGTDAAGAESESESDA